MRKKFQIPFLFSEFHLKGSKISIVDNPIGAIKIERKDGSYLIPIEEFLKAKKLLDGLSKEERKVLRKLRNILISVENY